MATATEPFTAASLTERYAWKALESHSEAVPMLLISWYVPFKALHHQGVLRSIPGHRLFWII